MQLKVDRQHRIQIGCLFARYNYQASSQINQEMNITRGLFGELMMVLGK